MKPLVVLPTYNEKDNLPVIVIKILDQEVFDVLIVDDSSTDGTTELAKNWVERDQRVHILQRPGKLGLGTAYTSGFKWGLERDYDCFVEMDADLSHDPLMLPQFLDMVESGSDLVIGSRYMGGTISVVGWDFKRLLLSRFGNLYASTLLRTSLCDMTSGFRAFSRRALEALDLDAIHSEGYAFQIEMAYRVLKQGMQVSELSIVFTERVHGKSKMSHKIIREAVALPWKLILERLTDRVKRSLGLKKRPQEKRSP
jgi:dolichol-phosphate mannosyltransferase